MKSKSLILNSRLDAKVNSSGGDLFPLPYLNLALEFWAELLTMATVHFLQKKEKDNIFSYINDLVSRRKEEVMNRVLLMAQFNFQVHLCPRKYSSTLSSFGSTIATAR